MTETRAAETKKAAAPKVGDVINVGTEDDPRFALVVGSEKVQHNDPHTDKKEELDHPLIIDLPPARRYEIEHTPAA